MKARKKYITITEGSVTDDIITVQSLSYDFGTIEAATNTFSNENKIGEGGFGAVYKGILPSGQEIAVKRLSKSSGQGAAEFKNEVVLVAKLQHRNLMRLLGLCLKREEKILIYEFVPNRSLDYFLFDPVKRVLLDWSKRYKIIGGIARGILYLHEDSRLKIIHRDLKASNVLLDEDMNAKISDFGLAKIFSIDQTQGNTSKIIGTYGYMSPEYAMHGQFSVKSDVFSFGVLILEIITGKKNSRFYQTNGAGDLPGHAWKHWRDEHPWNCWIQLWQLILIQEMKSLDASILAYCVSKKMWMPGLPCHQWFLCSTAILLLYNGLNILLTLAVAEPSRAYQEGWGQINLQASQSSGL